MDRIASRLRALSGRLLARILLTGLPLIVVAASGLALATFLLDFTLEVPRPVRVVFLLLGAATLAWVASRHLVGPLRRKPSLDELALMVERSDPEIEDQLISAVQLERDLTAGVAVESQELIRALVESTAQRFAKYSFSKAVDLRPIRHPLLAMALAVGVVTGLALAFPEQSEIWCRRQLLLEDVPWPRRTTLVIEIADVERFDPQITPERIILHVPERSPLQVQVRAEGLLPEDVDLVTAPLDDPDRESSIAMGRAPGREFFQHIFPPLTRSIVFSARGGDDTDGVPIVEVRVARAPRVTKFWAEYEYPDYTGLEDRRASDVNMSAPEGTRINMHFEVNMGLSAFLLEMDRGGKSELRPDAEGRFHYSFAVLGNDFYTFRLKGLNGVTSAEVPRYLISSEPDQEPRIVLSLPAQADFSVTTNATIPLLGVATDDHGITQVGLRYGSARDALTESAPDFLGNEMQADPRHRRVRFFRPLEVTTLLMRDAGDPATAPRPLREGDRFAFGLMATDNRRTSSRPDPHQVFSEVAFGISVVSAPELERELSQLQLGFKTRIERITVVVETRLADLRSLVQSLRESSDGLPDDFATNTWRAEQEQNRITSELVTARRQFVRMFDGHLWNRLDPGSFTESLIAVQTRILLVAGDAERHETLGQALKEIEPLIDEAQPMGRLAAILQLLLRTSVETSPEIHRQITRANLVTERDQRLALLGTASDLEARLLEELKLLEQKLQAWEDYLELVQKVQQLQEMQKGISDRIDSLRNK